MRALDEINEQLIQRVSMEIDMPDTNSDLEKALPLLQKQSPNNL